MASVSERFMRLFSGYEENYGRFDPPPQIIPGEKVHGKMTTEKGTITESLIARHLAGELGLGVIPLRKDNTLFFGAIDIDDRKIDHQALALELDSYGVPGLICRSKSGGAHVYFFFSSPCPAVVFRKTVERMLTTLGYSQSTEIFPKQVSRQRSEDIGNWINLPYMGGEETTRPALAFVGETFRRLTIEEFLSHAEGSKLDPMKFGEWNYQVDVPKEFRELLEGAPPCILSLFKRGGLTEGSRNEFLAHCAVFVKKKFPHEDHLDKMLELNAQFNSPPMKAGEVKGIIDSYHKKNYGYKCKSSPQKDFCNKTACREQLYGIGRRQPGEGEEDDLTFAGVIRYEPAVPELGDEVMYRIEFKRDTPNPVVFVNVAQLLSLTRFREATLSQANIHIGNFSNSDWIAITREITRKPTIVALPVDATAVGQIMYRIREFTEHQIQPDFDKLALGGTVILDGRAYFRSADLIHHLTTQRIQWGTPQKLWYIIESKLQGGQIERDISGRQTVLWWIPTALSDEERELRRTFAEERTEEI